MPAADPLSLPALLRSQADAAPDRVYLVEVTGSTVTYGEALDQSLRWAAAFTLAGVSRDDVVLSMQPTSITAVVSWLGAAWIGAVETAVNVDFRGRMLTYVMGDSGTELMVLHADYLDRLTPDAAARLRLLVVTGADAVPADLPCRSVTASEFLSDIEPDLSLAAPALHDIACMIYTSGTTGPSKGVRVPWGQLHATSPLEWSALYSEAEAQYVPFPMNHVGGKVPPYLMASHGARAVLRSSFSGSAFWDDVCSHGCTLAILAGSMQNFLWNQAPQPDDAVNPLRHVIMLPILPHHAQFAQRFGVHILTGYNMTEISTPLLFTTAIFDGRSCGRPRQGPPGYDVRVVDEHDREVAPGEIGELIVRTATPWTLNAGYHGRAESTVEAWRNGWFHTGDAFTYDADGNHFFVDRIKDAIRRRGENISSFEVESFVNEHPAVIESAAIPVPSEWGEDEVKVVVVLDAAATLDPAELVRFLIPRMPRYMVPRYVEFVTDLPKTEATQRVRKVELRRSPYTPGTWDREAAGIEDQR